MIIIHIDIAIHLSRADHKIIWGILNRIFTKVSVFYYPITNLSIVIAAEIGFHLTGNILLHGRIKL